MKFKISKFKWLETGRKAGWIKEAGSLSLPNQFVEKLTSFPETSMGAMTIKLALGNGQTISSVVVDQEGTILWVGGKRIERPEDLAFKPSDVVDVTSER